MIFRAYSLLSLSSSQLLSSLYPLNIISLKKNKTKNKTRQKEKEENARTSNEISMECDLCWPPTPGNRGPVLEGG